MIFPNVDEVNANVRTGSIGFVASYWFLFRIYGSIKVD